MFMSARSIVPGGIASHHVDLRRLAVAAWRVAFLLCLPHRYAGYLLTIEPSADGAMKIFFVVLCDVNSNVEGDGWRLGNGEGYVHVTQDQKLY